MPNYAGIYATPSGGDIGIGTLTKPTSNQWVTPEANAIYDWRSGTYKPTKTVQNRRTGFTEIVPANAIEQQDGSWLVPDAAGGGTSAVSGGVQVPYSNQTINPNDPNQRYRAVDIVKSPAVAEATSGLMAAFQKGAQDSMKGFDEYLTNFKTAMNTARGASEAATNPAGTIAALQGGQDRYTAALQKALADYEALNQATAGRTRGLVDEARGLIPSYDAAAQAAAERQLAALQANVSRYKAASGTPMGLGSNEMQQILRGSADILVPMEQAKIGQRYNVLSQYALPTEVDIANRETARIGSFNPAIAKAMFESGQATAQTIQQLQMLTSRMAREDAVAFMQSLSVPAQVQQQILTGQIGQLGALAGLEEMSRYRGLQDVLGAQLTPSVYYNMGTGGYPNANRYAPMTAGTGNTAMPSFNPLGAENAPVTVGSQVPGSQGVNAYSPGAGAAALAPGGGGMVWDANNQAWRNRTTGAVIPWSRYASVENTVQPRMDMPDPRYNFAE